MELDYKALYEAALTAQRAAEQERDEQWAREANRLHKARVWLGQLLATCYDPERTGGDVGYLSGRTHNAFDDLFIAIGRPDLVAQWPEHIASDDVQIMDLLRQLKLAEARATQAEAERDEARTVLREAYTFISQPLRMETPAGGPKTATYRIENYNSLTAKIRKVIGL